MRVACGRWEPFPSLIDLLMEFGASSFLLVVDVMRVIQSISIRLVVASVTSSSASSSSARWLHQPSWGELDALARGEKGTTACEPAHFVMFGTFDVA